MDESLQMIANLLMFANDLLRLMGTKAKVTAAANKDTETVDVNIDSPEEAGLLIGKRGETLSSFQTVLNLMVRQKMGDWKRIVVNVGDWREKKEDHLKTVAMETAERVKETGKEESLYNLNPAERRIIHLVLSEVEGVETESVGEGSERYLVVRPSQTK